MRWHLAMVVLVGCAKPPAIAYIDLESELADARCERLARCGAFPDVDACAGFFRARHDADLAAAVNAGIVRYDGELARLCVDALAAQACDATLREVRVPPQSCTRMLVGTRHGGDACELDEECASRICEQPSATCAPGTCCPGTCLEVEPLGDVEEDCIDNRYCAADRYCSSEDHKCHALEADGASCFVDAQCDYGLVCDTSAFPGSCIVAAPTGEACPDGRCAELGARCVNGTCTLATIGAACTSASDCTAFARCDATMHCAPLPTVGEACPDSACAGEAWCDPMTRMCRPPLALHEPCGANNQCATFLCKEGPAFDSCEQPALCF